jgi:hypothetical protein
MALSFSKKSAAPALLRALRRGVLLVIETIIYGDDESGVGFAIRSLIQSGMVFTLSELFQSE